MIISSLATRQMSLMPVIFSSLKYYDYTIMKYDTFIIFQVNIFHIPT